MITVVLLYMKNVGVFCNRTRHAFRVVFWRSCEDDSKLFCMEKMEIMEQCRLQKYWVNYM